MIRGVKKSIRRSVVRLFLVLAGSMIVVPSAALASGGDLNCPDFGTRERAQKEFEKQSSDIHNLDGDKDGRACEGNRSTGWWGWPLASV
jgi:hypothetical protein